MNKRLTGKPSVDQPWLKYYTSDAKNIRLPNDSVYSYLYESNKNRLEDTAIIYNDNRISFRELFQNVDLVTHSFYALGVREGDVVSFIAFTTPEVIYSFYALSRIGAIANMLDPRMPEEMMNRMIKNVESEYLVTMDLFEDSIEINQVCDNTVILIQTGIDKREGKDLTNVIRWVDFIKTKTDEVIKSPDNPGPLPVYIAYTGGTTGIPKGVLLSNNNINALAAQFAVNGVPFRKNDMWQCVAAPFIAYVFTLGTHVPLTQGVICKIVIYDPDLLANDFLSNKYTHINANPTVWSKIMNSTNAKQADFSNLVLPISGADIMSEDMQIELDRFLYEHGCKNKICNGYGMTESGIAGCVNLSPEINKIGSVGIPFVKTVFSVYDEETKEELTYNEIGEICISGPCVMIGYVNDSAATDAVLIKHKDGRLWLHTGDYGHIDEDGFVFIDGRIKRMIIRSNGAKVFPLEVEKVVNKIDGVYKSALVGKKEPNSEGAEPILFVVKKENYEKEQLLEDIMKSCEDNLQNYSIPVKVVFLEEIPLTPIGKVDYRALEQMTEVL